ncbi:MAG: hypothetical protein AB7K04_03820 [Pseudorhodoplanes sp.]
MRLLIACATSACLWPVAAGAAEPMPPKDIQSGFFNGQPFTAATPSNVQFRMVATPDGKITREPVGKAGAKGEGTWKLTKDGFCTSWSGAKSNCFRLIASGGKWSVMAGSTLVAIWTK